MLNPGACKYVEGILFLLGWQLHYVFFNRMSVAGANGIYPVEVSIKNYGPTWMKTLIEQAGREGKELEAAFRLF